MSVPVIPVTEAAGKALTQGHPWVYRAQVTGQRDLPPGTWVQVRGSGFAGYGLWEPQGAIAVRLFSRQGVPDAAWVAARVAEAWAGREAVRAGATTAYRWVYGEGDGLPGIVVDLYGSFAVVRTYVESVEKLVPWVADALHAHTALDGIVVRRPDAEPKPWWGRPPGADLVVEEHGLLFRADLMVGQKTGLYFDQRENRRFLAPWCQGRRVLDAFCYTGGFGLYAAQAGAAAVTLCDQARAALDAAQANFGLNGLDTSVHTFVADDCFGLLQRYAAQGVRFDVVIVDPPSLARDKASRHAAERAYVRLNRDAMRCVEPGGLLAAASCTSQVPPEAFRAALAEAARQAGRRLLLIHDAGQPVDHPVAAHFPEGRYLKFVLARVLPLV